MRQQMLFDFPRTRGHAGITYKEVLNETRHAGARLFERRATPRAM
jgi:hypothetical protein